LVSRHTDRTPLGPIGSNAENVLDGPAGKWEKGPLVTQCVGVIRHGLTGRYRMVPRLTSANAPNAA